MTQTTPPYHTILRWEKINPHDIIITVVTITTNYHDCTNARSIIVTAVVIINCNYYVVVIVIALLLVAIIIITRRRDRFYLYTISERQQRSARRSLSNSTSIHFTAFDQDHPDVSESERRLEEKNSQRPEQNQIARALVGSVSSRTSS